MIAYIQLHINYNSASAHLQAFGHIQEGGSPRAAVQEFVAAANRKVHVSAGQINMHRAGAVRQIPHHQSAPAQ